MNNQAVLEIVGEIREKAYGPNGACLNWDSIDFRVRNFNQMMQMTNTYVANGQEGDYDPDDFLGMRGKHLQRMKVAAYEKGRGSWVSLELTLYRDQETELNLMFDEEVIFTDVIYDARATAGSVLSELAAFPRYRENIPQWMATLVEEAGESLVVLDPDTDELVYGAERTPYKEPSL